MFLNVYITFKIKAIFWGDKNVLEFGSWLHNLVNILKTTKSHTFKGLILWLCELYFNKNKIKTIINVMLSSYHVLIYSLNSHPDNPRPKSYCGQWHKRRERSHSSLG